MNEDAAAMKAVIADMGRAAKAAKVSKYRPKPPPAAEAAPAEADPTADVSPSELEALLAGG